MIGNNNAIYFSRVIELERHIEILLLDNDCVIVPDLGGFMSHYIEARYDDRENLYLPPLRTLGFNPKLTMNDSLLAQSYVEAYDISFPEAISRIEKEVSELHQHLENEGYYELYDIGTLRLNGEGNYEFFNKCRQRVMTALPCCPHCHMRLPKGWGEAEDFFIVSLIGPARIGKTMMRLSLMADQWKALVRNVQINGSPVNIMPAHYIGYGGFYDEIIEMAEQLSNDGICPHPIDRNKLIQPLFLNVVYKGHRMIVGIYDIASYKPDKPFELWNRYLKYAIDNRIDPVSIKEGEACESTEDYFVEGEIKKRPLDMYHVMNFQRYGRRAVPDKKSSRHFRGVIVKSDLLQPIVDEGKYGILFRDTFEDPSDRDAVLTTNEIIKDMIKEYRLFGNLSDNEIDDIGSNYKKGRRSWHCISALGCGEDMGGKLEGDYAPIRVAEPFIRCIVDRIADNGWIDEKH